MFFTGLLALVRQEFRSQAWIHSVMPFCTYWESVVTVIGSVFHSA